MVELGQFERVELRDAWRHEAYNFTPWLAEGENLALLSSELGLDLELVGQEVSVGPYAADIVCRNALDGSHVLIENQLEKTDHSHLGQIMTYAAALEAKTVIWIAAHFTDEHRAAIDWLNEITHDEWQFFGLEIELWRINQSVPAPKFNIVSRPNDWSRAVRDEAARVEANSPTRKARLQFWSAFHEHMQSKALWAPRPSAESWQSFSIGKTGFSLETVIKFREQQLMVRLYINCNDPAPKDVFWYLHSKKEEIEAAIGLPMQWNELPDRKGSVILVSRTNVNLDDESCWPEYHTWFEAIIGRMQRTFKPLILSLETKDLSLSLAEEYP